MAVAANNAIADADDDQTADWTAPVVQGLQRSRTEDIRQHRIGGHNVAGDPAEQRAAGPDQHTETLQHGHQQGRAGDDQRHAGGETEDNERRLDAGGMRHVDARRRDIGRGGDGDDIVEAHDNVGDGDNAHRAPQGFAAFDSLAVRIFRHQFDCDPEQKCAADQLEERIVHRLGDNQREDDAQQHGDAGAEHHAPQTLLRRQRHAGHGDHDGIIAGQDDIDADDLNRGDPERRLNDVLPEKFH